MDNSYETSNLTFKTVLDIMLNMERIDFAIEFGF